jgi:pimeloyl-ACP methyl ester carboxylesterase
MLRAVNDKMSVVFYDLANSDVKPAGVEVGGGKARDLVWANNEHVLILASQSTRVQVTTGLETLEFFRWFSVSKSSMKSVVLFGNEGRYYIPSAGNLIATNPSDDRHAVFARITNNNVLERATDTRIGGGRSDFTYDLYDGNLLTGETDHSASGRPGTYDWLVTPSGEPLGRIDYDDRKGESVLYLKADGQSEFKRINAYADKPGAVYGFELYGLAPDGQNLVAAKPGEGNRRSLFKIDPASGETTATLFSNPKYDIDKVVFDYRAAKVTGVRFTDDIPQYVHFDPAEQKIQTSLEKALPSASPSIISKSADGSKMVVKALYTDHPEQYFLFDRSAKTLNMVASAYPAIDGKIVARKERFDHVSPDGLNIPGYLTVPTNAGKKNMPLIVLPHGGPQGRDDMTFDWWPFFYAANGYLVYQPNFRGSDGYGADFVSAGFGEWGLKMQDDITYGVKKLVADGIADPKRICIVGASYGGYAALAGATLTPELYACAVSINGVSNLPALIGRSARSSDWAEDYWDVRIGSRFRDKAALEAVSPNANAAKAQAPVMIMHGRDDTVVPFSHAIRMNDALRAAKKPVELVELKGEDHWLSRAATRTTMLEKSLEFINRHIGAENGG